MRKRTFSTRTAIILLSVFCLFLIATWFRDREFLATGEEGLFLYNPQRSLELIRNSWVEIGPGVSGFSLITRLPLLFTAIFFVKLLNPWLTQALLFLILLLVGSVSVFLLIKELFRNNEKLDINKIAFLGGLFYILNPVSMLGVWYRFIYPFFFFFALSPLFFYLFIRGIHEKDIRFIFISSLLTLPFSAAFGGPSLALALWILPFLYVSTFILKKGLNPFPFFYLILTFIFWLGINSWWVLPYLSVVSSQIEFTQIQNLQHNIGTLVANSKDFGLGNIIRLIHGGVLYRGEAFGTIYKTKLFLIASWVIPTVTFYGLFRLKNLFVRNFLLVSMFVLLFLSKGTSPPLGQVFLWLFTHIQPMQLFRNPFEKFGLLLPIIYAPLFGFGVIKLLARQRGLRKYVVLVLIVSSLILMQWPFFTGAIVVYGGRDIRVVVPESFDDFNRMDFNENHRILNLPLMGGASGFYNWGYAGIEPSEVLFKYPIISRVIYGDSFFDQLVAGVSKGLADENLIGVAQLFATDLVAFRKDTNVIPHGAYFDALTRTEKMIRTSDLERIFDSNEFSMFKLQEKDVNPVVYAPDSFILGSSSEELLTLLNQKKFDPQRQVFICTQPDSCKSSVNEEVIKGLAKIGRPDSIQYVRISSSEYNIKVKGSRGPFVLVFANSYHPGWEVSYDNGKLSHDYHFVINGYENGYIIDKQGDFSLDLMFTPQKVYRKYFGLSGGFILLGALFILVASLRRREKPVG